MAKSWIMGGDFFGPYMDRTYRRMMGADDLTAFSVVIEQTDLFILAERDLTFEATRAARDARATIEGWIERVPEFGNALTPLPCPADAPALVRQMTAAGKAAGVGPMAAVAGAIAEAVARALGPKSTNIIIENGGDIFIMGNRERRVALFAGPSPLTNRLALVIPGSRQPLAVCTSSGTVGPSLSFGRADAAVIVAEDGALADAVATATGNRIHRPKDLASAVEWAAAVPGILHVIAILGEHMATWGELQLQPLR
ncbi:MAG: UPF0280 family protein [Candidatus Zipacnadales bacterium]